MTDPTTQTRILSSEERAEALSRQVATEVNMNGYRVESHGAGIATLVKGRRPNHLLHLILTLVTIGMWVWVWIILAIVQREHRLTLTVDQFGYVHRTS